MKKSLCLVTGLLALNLTPVFGQPNAVVPPSLPQPPATTFQQRLQAITRVASSQTEAPALTKFNLDFPGGTPKELVAAIEKATGKSLNAIIPTEDADVNLPPLKMNNVNVPQLFNAVVNMSYKYAPSGRLGGFGGGPNMGRDVVSSYGFETRDSQSGELSDDSIWYFFVYKASTPQPPPPVEKICQFYSLSPYLDRGFTVDDITTAIQTGWKMAGETPAPELNYHKETKLLIAYGEPNKLQTIQQVLQTLPPSNATRDEIDRLKNDMANQQDFSRQIPALNKDLNLLRRAVERLNAEYDALSTAQTASNNIVPAEKSGK